MATKIQASQRLKLSSKLMKATNKELPRFRYLDDALRFVESIGSDLEELKQVVRIQHSQLAKVKEAKPKFAAFLTKAASLEFNLAAPNTKRTLKRKVEPNFTRTEIPNLSKLEQQYALSEDLYSKLKALQMAEAQIMMQFSEKGKALESALAEISVLKDETAALLKETLSFLSSVAKAHVPKIFDQYMQAIIGELEKHVQFERSEQFLYVNLTSQGRIAFTNYVMLINAVNEAGEITPHLYISVHWIVGEEVQIALSHEFEPPTQLDNIEGAFTVASLSEAVQAIAQQLEEEGFSSSLGTVPLMMKMKDTGQVDLNVFAYKDFLSKVKVSDGRITFTLKKSAYSAYESVMVQLFEELQPLLNQQPAIWKIETVGKPKEVTFVLKARGAYHISLPDASYLKEKLGISDEQLKELVEILNK
jgi:hypothetical protein